MRISAAGLDLIKTFEGFRETAVRIPDGRWTIGYGHVRTAREGLTITTKDAEDLLRQDLRSIEAAVGSLIYAPLMQGQFDALVSLAFNISLGHFRESEILQKLNAGDYLGAANGFDAWRKARLHDRVMVVDALVRRRAAEKSMFLDHPSGPPSAPTPLVVPRMDHGVEDSLAVDGPEGDIAAAVRRLAERTQGAILPPQEIPLPPGATLVPPPPPEAAERREEPAAAPDAEPRAPEAHAAESQAEVTPEGIARASKTMAERVSLILNGVADKIEKHEAAAMPSISAPPAQPVVRDGLPDFDQPGEKLTPAAAMRARSLIDDTEVVEPGHDPAVLFANGERKAKVVNGHARRVGPLSGRMLAMAPWIVVLVLSVIGLAVGMVDTLKGDGIEAGVPRLASTILAVFGVMTVMSVYYLLRNRSSDET